jgi:hypothetical protein
MEKKIRFGELVRHSGRPQVVTLWTEPSQDRRLARAIKENRVLTVIQEHGTRDYGLAGLQEHPHAIYVIFPRPLPQLQDSRVIGINYQLLEEAEVADSVRAEEPRPKARPAKPKPARKPFTVRVRRTATVEEEMVVLALNQAQAEREAKERAKGEPFEVAKAEVREEIVNTE